MLFRAPMQTDAKAPTRSPSHLGEGGWEGPVFLPTPVRAKKRQSRMFFARIHGDTQTYSFFPDEDVLVFAPRPDMRVATRAPIAPM